MADTITSIATLYKLRHEELLKLTSGARIGGTVKVVLNFYRFIANVEKHYPEIELRENELCSSFLGFDAYYKRFLMNNYDITPEIIMVGYRGDTCADETVENYVNSEADKLEEISKYLNGVYAINIGNIHPRFALQVLLSSIKFSDDECFILGLSNTSDMLSICKTMRNIIGISLCGKHTSIMDRDSLAPVMEVFRRPEEYLALVGCNEITGVKGYGPKKARTVAVKAFNSGKELDEILKAELSHEDFDIYLKNIQMLSFKNFYVPEKAYKIKLCEQFINLFDSESLDRLNHEYFYLFPIDTRVL